MAVDAQARDAAKAAGEAQRRQAQAAAHQTEAAARDKAKAAGQAQRQAQLQADKAKATAEKPKGDDRPKSVKDKHDEPHPQP